ncbi:MAG: hypothetical protein Q4G05_06600, partial [Clostridia bacterium]|nr:hypothetical protein [Clostridia bacterium]
NLERGLENGRVHLSVEDYKKITDFEKTKVTIQDIELDLPEVPNIKDFNKLIIGRDEKIQELIIKPKDEIIQKLYEDNRTLNYEIVKQINLVDKAKRYEKERKSILLENKELHKKCETIENDYNTKLKEETRKIKNKYEDEIYNLEKENNFLRKIIYTLEKTVDKFIHWVCSKFSVSSEEDFIRDFQEENNIYIDPEKQIEYEEENEI